MNCKPGDLAYIVQSKVSEVIGRIIEVGAFLPVGRYEHPDMGRIIVDEPSYEITFIGAPGFGMKQNTGKYPSQRAYIADRKLRPISGVPVHDEQPDEVTA